MRSSLTRAVWILAMLAPIASWGAEAGPDEALDDGLDVYFRDVDLGALSPQALEVYIDTEPGESKKLERAFPDAPPQISHTVEDMLPITRDDNECLECHHPENVTEEEDLPVPDSHFQQPVLVAGKADEAMRSKVKGYRKGDDVAGTRFDCTMCHTPQATNVRTPASTFVRVQKSPRK